MAGKADAEATFAVNLEDGASGPAEDAAKALERLQRAMERDTKELAAMQRAMKNLQAGSSVNVDTFRKLKGQIDAKKASIAQAQSAYVALGGSFSNTAKKAKPVGMSFQQIGVAAQGLGGPLGGMAGRLSSLSSLLAGGAIALGVAAIAAAIVALTVAAIAGVAALAKYGIAVANARRAEGLRLEGLTKMRNWWGIAAGNAGEMQSAIDRVTASTAIGRDKAEGYAAQLYKLHLRGTNLSEALEATAIKAAVLGEEGAKHFMGLAASAAFSGQSVKRLADDVRARFGGIAAKQMLDLDVQGQKLRESFAALFSGLKIEGLLKAISSVTSLFSQSTASGRALKSMLERLFQPIVGAIEMVAPLVKRFFQGMILGALNVGIALLTVRKWFKQTFGDSAILKGMDLTSLALKAGVVAALWLAGVVGVLTATFVAFMGPALLAGAALLGLAKLGEKAWQLFKSIDWTELGKSIVDGIVGGLKRGARWVIDAVKGLGDSAMTALKSKLGIASPSKAFAKLGVAIPQGIETGVETGTPGARDAVARIVDAPRLPASAMDASAAEAPAASSSRGPTNVTLNVGGIHIDAKSDDAPTDILAEIERGLGTVLERTAIQLGALVPGG